MHAQQVGLLDVLGGAREDESHVLRNKKPIPEMFFDDLVEYQPGLFMRNERGIAQVCGQSSKPSTLYSKPSTFNTKPLNLNPQTMFRAGTSCSYLQDPRT